MITHWRLGFSVPSHTQTLAREVCTKLFTCQSLCIACCSMRPALTPLRASMLSLHHAPAAAPQTFLVPRRVPFSGLHLSLLSLTRLVHPLL